VVKDDRLETCTVHFRRRITYLPHDADESASQNLRSAILERASIDGEMNCPLLLQLTRRITPLVDTSPEVNFMVLPGGTVLLERNPASDSVATCDPGPRIPLEESLESLERELVQYWSG
jgi:hypothetical protein